MSYYNINANALDEEELNYELCIRGCSVDGSLDTRRRTLRKVLREVEVPEVRESVHSFEDEFDVVPVKLQQIEKQVQTGVESGSWSRLVHLHKRLRRYGTFSQDQLNRKSALLDAVTRMAMAYFNVDLNEISQDVPLMTLVPVGLALVAAGANQVREDTGASQSQPGPTNWEMPNPQRLGAVPKKQATGESLILFSPEPQEELRGIPRRQTFPAMSGYNPGGFDEPLQPVKASLEGTPERNQSPQGAIGFGIGVLGTPQYRTSVQMQINRPSPIPKMCGQPIGESSGVNRLAQFGHDEQVKSYGMVGAEVNQDRALEHCQHRTRDSAHASPVWPQLSCLEGSPHRISVDNRPPSVPRVVTHNVNPNETRMNDNEYVHKSEIEGYIRNYLNQIYRRAPSGPAVNSPIIPSLLDQFANLQVHERNASQMQETNLLPPMNRVSSLSLDPPLQLTRGRPELQEPVRVQIPMINERMPNMSTRPVSRAPLVDETFQNPRSFSPSANPNNPYRTRLPHQTCNIIEKWPKFSGDSNPVPVVDFLRQLEILSRSYQITNRELRMHAHLLFKDDAYVWFTAYDSKMDTWETLLTYLKMRYDNPNRDRYIKEEMRNRKQRPNELFSAYLTDLEAMSQRMIRKMSDEEKFDIIVENMKLSYKRRLALEPVYSIEHLAQLCYKFDALEGNLYNPRTPSKPNLLNQLDFEDEMPDDSTECEEADLLAIQRSKNWKPVGKSQLTVKETAEQAAEMSLCWNCRKNGHLWRDCEQRKQIFCHICGNAETTAYQCPQKHNLRPKNE
ncbi:uncharacterized protein LOC134291483 [Aedes albopictus]|uniref:CCHC-type domain-containing protein n=1 Tax=Aedes albopictus TaxID=7160 RepID=A0ABM1YDB8_AEDAL